MTDNWYFNHCRVFSCSSAHTLKVSFENYKKHFRDRACRGSILRIFFLFFLPVAWYDKKISIRILLQVSLTSKRVVHTKHTPPFTV